MDDPLDAAPLDDAHPHDAHARAETHTTESLRYRMLVRMLAAHDPKFTEPAHDALGDRIAALERACADILHHLHPDERDRIAPMLPIDLRAH